MAYSPNTSGVLTGGGNPNPPFRRWDVDDWREIPVSDGTRIKREVPDYDPAKTYTQQEIVMLTEKILRCDPKPVQAHPQILLGDHYKERAKREIHTACGTPDPSIVSGLYWRTHPNGRKVNSDEQRQKNGACYYR